MRTAGVLATVLGLASVSHAHMIMASPVPYGKSTLNNSPLAADGSDFPCKQRSGVYDAEGASNTLTIGSTQPLSFIGGATHGGGSCQISVTYDQNPTANSVFKVIYSIEGSCPVKNQTGNIGDDANSPDPDTYSFTVPSSLPTGNATLAWTWFNKVGNREMYMNCAPVTITGGSAKRSEENLDDLMAHNVTQLMQRDTSAYDALPDMFVANIGNGCKSVDSADLQFPDPGSYLEILGTTTANPVPPTGTGCAVAVAGVPNTAGSGSSASSAAASDVTSAPTLPSSTASDVTSAPTVPSSTAALPGGVFATVATSAASQPPAISPSAPTSAAASPVAESSVAASSTVASITPSSAGSASTGTTGSDGSIAAGTACSSEGMWNCIGGTAFQQCASGIWQPVQQMAAGTTCTPGESMSFEEAAAKLKRAIRFSTEHVRRNMDIS
jgi:hypothetical protein